MISPAGPGSRDPHAFVPLKPVLFLLLVSLLEGQRHGYALKKAVADRTDNRVRLGPATLYRSIRHLLESGLIEESGERPDPELDDERRRYYALTDLGRQVIAAEAGRLGELVDAVQTLLPGGPR